MVHNRFIVYFICLAIIFIYNYVLFRIFHHFNDKGLTKNDRYSIDDKERQYQLYFNESLPPIYVITPSANSITQKAHLTRLAQTLALVPNVRWIVVEDSPVRTKKIAKILAKSRHPYAHLNIHREYGKAFHHHDGCAQRNLALAWLRNKLTEKLFSQMKGLDSDTDYESLMYDDTKEPFLNLPNVSKPFSNTKNTHDYYMTIAKTFPTTYRKSLNPFNIVPNLNKILRAKANVANSVNDLNNNSAQKDDRPTLKISNSNAYTYLDDDLTPTQVWDELACNLEFPGNGVIYFADDDNTYDLEIFSQMRRIRKMGVWPVALCGGIYAEKPKVKNGKVIGWDVTYMPQRVMATDMAGFAINVKLVLELRFVYFPEFNNKEGLETYFVGKYGGLSDLEPLANNCTQILVWHTQTQPPKLILEEKYRKANNRSSADGYEI